MNAYREVGSGEALEYHKARIGFTSMTASNWNFAEWTEPGFYPGGPAGKKWTYREGFQAITERMMDKVLENTRLVFEKVCWYYLQIINFSISVETH